MIKIQHDIYQFKSAITVLLNIKNNLWRSGFPDFSLKMEALPEKQVKFEVSFHIL